ncbi:MAG TPA: hypothetical protein VGR71_11730 [Nitrospira sp.]|nr:hypothetical protein [Nitrospira sp.]
MTFSLEPNSDVLFLTVKAFLDRANIAIRRENDTVIVGAVLAINPWTTPAGHVSELKNAAEVYADNCGYQLAAEWTLGVNDRFSVAIRPK